MNITAIILGATGVTGNALLKQLLKDDSYTTIRLISRSSVNIKHPKIEEHLVDMMTLSKHKQLFDADVVFCCIGTTKAKTPDKEKYKAIDYGIPVEAAKLSNANNVSKFLVMSSMGADANSGVFYNKVKGEMEQDVLAQSNLEVYVFQPSLIAGERDEKRVGESIAKALFSIVNPILPKKWQSVMPKTIAKAMQVVAEKGFDENRITSDKIQELGKYD